MFIQADLHIGGVEALNSSFEPEKPWTNLPEALASFGWEPYLDPYGNIIALDLVEDISLGVATEMWEVLAPFVDSGSFIEIFDEHGDPMRWHFDGSGVHMDFGTVIYDCEQERQEREIA
jgi:hypothetical protein